MTNEPKHINILDQPQVVEGDHTEYPAWLTDEIAKLDISANVLNHDQELQLPPYMMSHKGVGFGALGSIGSVTGQKKNGKTLMETLFMATVLLDGKPLGDLKYELHDERPNPKVLFIDTEQEDSFALMVQRRVHYLLNWDFRENNDRFKVIWLHDVESHTERWKIARAAIWQFKPDFIVLDGSRDMVSDINEAVECTTFVRQTMKIATDGNKSLLYQALHYNPGSEKMRGWLGTELGNRVAEVWECAKKNENGVETFQGLATDTRGKTPSPIEWYVDDTHCKFGIPTPLNADLILERMDQEIRKKDTEELTRVFEWMGAKDHSYGSVRETIKKMDKIGSTKADRMIGDAVKLGVLIRMKDANGNETNRYMLNLTTDATPQTLPIDTGNSLGDDTGGAPF